MSRLRIVAGEFGGRRIDAPPGRRVRPTREKVREAWFSALGPDLAGTRVVDLFAGSGALGLEALSRGAASVHFVESDRRAAAVLASNVETLGVRGRAEIVRADVASFLDEREGEPPWDLALADPPYGSDWPRRLADRLRRTAFARLLCIEHEPGALDRREEGVVWRRRYGDSALTFLRPPAAEGGIERSRRTDAGGGARAMNDERVAVYPGSFDPLTHGHADLAERALKLVDRLVVAVAETATEEKEGLFTIDERVRLIGRMYRDRPDVDVVSFSGLLVEFARSQGARILVRGLRAVSDFEYEFQMAQMNRSLWPEVETIFMAPDNEYTFLSASLVREVARLGGDVSDYVPEVVLEEMVDKFGPSARGG